jgi:hypothetical protein
LRRLFGLREHLNRLFRLFLSLRLFWRNALRLLSWRVTSGGRPFGWVRAQRNRCDVSGHGNSLGTESTDVRLPAAAAF